MESVATRGNYAEEKLGEKQLMPRGLCISVLTRIKWSVTY